MLSSALASAIISAIVKSVTPSARKTRSATPVKLLRENPLLAPASSKVARPVEVQSSTNTAVVPRTRQPMLALSTAIWEAPPLPPVISNPVPASVICTFEISKRPDWATAIETLVALKPVTVAVPETFRQEKSRSRQDRSVAIITPSMSNPM